MQLIFTVHGPDDRMPCIAQQGCWVSNSARIVKVLIDSCIASMSCNVSEIFLPPRRKP